MSKLHRYVGFCLYCGSREPPLTREHVLPRGLGGNKSPEGDHEAVILQKATCEKCRKITQRIEEDALVGMDNVRNIYGMKRKDRTAKKIFAPFVNFGSKPEMGSFDPKDIGASLLLPIFDKAGGPRQIVFTTGAYENIEYIQETTKLHSIAYLTIFKPNFEAVGNIGVAHEMKLSLISFTKMLAKIAIGFAAFRFGAESFYPNIAAYIRGEDDSLINMVGGFGAFSYNEPKRKDLHIINTEVRHFNGVLCPVVYIRIFAAFGGPTYYVYIGPFKDQKLPPRDS